jgi:hypothetical protein
MAVYIEELYPTVCRAQGTGFTNGIGMFGPTFAVFINDFSKQH